MAQSTVYRIKGKMGINAMPISSEQINEIRQAFDLFISDA